VAATGEAVSKSVESGGGETIDLAYPKTLSAKEQDEAAKKLSGISAELAQQLLDELAACIGTNVIRKTPLAYLRGLIARARAGTFTPECALQVAEQRERHVAQVVAMKRSDTRRNDDLAAEIDTEKPLVKKLLRIQNRLHEKDQ
jgi:hypothetical protein